MGWGCGGGPARTSWGAGGGGAPWAGSPTVTSGRPMQTGPTPCSRWATGARRGRAQRSSTGSLRSTTFTAQTGRCSTPPPSTRRCACATSPTSTRAGRRSTLGSAELYRRAVGLMPGGVNSPVRAMRQIGLEHPIFVARGEGCELVDVDGNRYVDWVCSWGPLILGHAHPRVLEAVRDAASSGTSFGAPTEAEVELAAEVCERFRSVEMVRMVNSGTEATMSAIDRKSVV